MRSISLGEGQRNNQIVEEENVGFFFVFFLFFSTTIGHDGSAIKASSVLGDTEAKPKRKMQFLVLSDYIMAQFEPCSSQFTLYLNLPNNMTAALPVRTSIAAFKPFRAQWGTVTSRKE